MLSPWPECATSNTVAVYRSRSPMVSFERYSATSWLLFSSSPALNLEKVSTTMSAGRTCAWSMACWSASISDSAFKLATDSSASI